MTKSCFKKSSRPTCFRVSFSKVVGVRAGQPEKLKRVNATNLAGDVLRNNGHVDSKTMRRLVNKHRQHGSTKKAIQETIQTLEKLHNRVSINKGAITTIGAYYVSNKNILDTIDWGTKIWDARNRLKGATAK